MNSTNQSTTSSNGSKSLLRVAVESPLRAPTREEIEENKEYAKACMRDSLRRGEAPFAMHLLYDQTGILDELSPGDREKGIAAGLAWTEKADLVAVYVDRGITNGMRAAIGAAQARGIPCEFRQLGTDI